MLLWVLLPTPWNFRVRETIKVNKKVALGESPTLQMSPLSPAGNHQRQLLRGIIQVKCFHSAEFNKSCGGCPGCLSHPFLFERVMSPFLMVRPSLQRSLAGRSFLVLTVISVPWLHRGVGVDLGEGCVYSLRVHIDSTQPVWSEEVLNLLSVMHLHGRTVGGTAVCAPATLNAIPTQSGRGLHGGCKALECKHKLHSRV